MIMVWGFNEAWSNSKQTIILYLPINEMKSVAAVNVIKTGYHNSSQVLLHR